MKLRSVIAILSVVLIAFSIPQRAGAISFNLDSIAAWGKFPRFCVNTYRWGDKFFNGYDTTFVAPSGYKFNAKITADSWAEGYNFQLPDRSRIFMASDNSTSAGLYLTYLAVSVGYDINLSKLFGGQQRSRKRFRFGFNCMLFGAEFYTSKNDVGTTIKRFGPYSHLNLPFDGVDNSTWGLDAYYFFSHKQYSEAATFSFSRIQRKSHGSFYTGFSIYSQKLDFNFNNLPEPLKDILPATWPDKHYRVNTHNYAVRFGYGYNWVFSPKWVLGVSESPIIGVRKGFVVSDIEKTSVSIYNRLKLSVVWNSGKWFCGVVCKADLAIFSDKQTLYAGGTVSGEAVLGYRFNLW